MGFAYETTVRPEWIDYNGHMRDSYYGLVFSLAVDAFQDEVGFDARYREATGCTIYLVEDHKCYLREVHEGDALRVETLLVSHDDKRFLLYMRMYRGDVLVCVGEFVELHVSQHPKPHAEPIPDAIQSRLRQAVASPDQVSELSHRARSFQLETSG